MSSEKIIKRQAKDLLKGNWIAPIAALAVLLAAYLSIEYITTAVTAALRCVDFTTLQPNPNRPIEYLCTIALKLLLVLAASPLINGAVKTVCRIALEGKCDMRDIFYFYTSFSKFFKAVVVDACIFSIYSFLSLIADFYLYASHFIGAELGDELLNTGQTAILIITFIGSVTEKLIVYFLFVHFPLLAFSSNDSDTVGKYIFGYTGFAFRHFGAAVRLFFSFSGWILLCFFVVPAIYVIPYFFCSMALSAKWLWELERTGGEFVW